MKAPGVNRKQTRPLGPIMKKLSINWFSEGLLDFEYKKYTLLDYLQGVKNQFAQSHLYPAFSDLRLQYKHLQAYQTMKNSLDQQFPKDLSGIHPEKLELEYTSRHSEREEIREIDEIVQFALPRVRYHLNEGKEIYNFIDENLEIGSVGLLPLYKNEGYLLLREGNRKEVKAYEYQITLFEQADEKFRSLKTKPAGVYDYGISNTLESVKRKLIKRFQALPNPATYFIYASHSFPEKESLIPVAKRKFLRYLSRDGT